MTETNPEAAKKAAGKAGKAAAKKDKAAPKKTKPAAKKGDKPATDKPKQENLPNVRRKVRLAAKRAERIAANKKAKAEKKAKRLETLKAEKLAARKAARIAAAKTKKAKAPAKTPAKDAAKPAEKKDDAAAKVKKTVKPKALKMKGPVSAAARKAKIIKKAKQAKALKAKKHALKIAEKNKAKSLVKARLAATQEAKKKALKLFATYVNEAKVSSAKRKEMAKEVKEATLKMKKGKVRLPARENAFRIMKKAVLMKIATRVKRPTYTGSPKFRKIEALRAMTEALVEDMLKANVTTIAGLEMKCGPIRPKSGPVAKDPRPPKVISRGARRWAEIRKKMVPKAKAADKAPAKAAKKAPAKPKKVIAKGGKLVYAKVSRRVHLDIRGNNLRLKGVRNVKGLKKAHTVQKRRALFMRLKALRIRRAKGLAWKINHRGKSRGRSSLARRKRVRRVERLTGMRPGPLRTKKRVVRNPALRKTKTKTVTIMTKGKKVTKVIPAMKISAVKAKAAKKAASKKVLKGKKTTKKVVKGKKVAARTVKGKKTTTKKVAGKTVKGKATTKVAGKTVKGKTTTATKKAHRTHKKKTTTTTKKVPKTKGISLRGPKDNKVRVKIIKGNKAIKVYKGKKLGRNLNSAIKALKYEKAHPKLLALVKRLKVNKQKRITRPTSAVTYVRGGGKEIKEIKALRLKRAKILKAIAMQGKPKCRLPRKKRVPASTAQWVRAMRAKKLDAWKAKKAKIIEENVKKYGGSTRPNLPKDKRPKKTDKPKTKPPKKDEEKPPKKPEGKVKAKPKTLEKRVRVSCSKGKKPLRAGCYRVVKGKQEIIRKKIYVTKAIGGAKNGTARRVLQVKRPAYYAAQPNKKTFPKRKAKRNLKPLRSSLTPGTVCVLIAGIHKGKKVVFLKRLDSGLCLITGPFKINGCPMRRVNQNYLIATSTKIVFKGVKVPKHVNDDYFRRQKAVCYKKGLGDVFAQKPKKYVASEQRKKDQKLVDDKVISSIQWREDKKMLFGYLGSKFGLRTRMYPHRLKF